MTIDSTGVFDSFRLEAWNHEFAGQLSVVTIVGGVPSNDRVAEGWIKSKLGLTNDRIIQEAVAQTMAERGVTADEATKIVNEMKNLNGFKRDDKGLYIEGRQLKAAIKEAASVALAAGKLEKRGWGETNKGLLSFLAEHVFVVEDRLHLVDADGNNITAPTNINQRFVSTFRGTGIQYEEYVAEANISFTVRTDYEFSEKDWAMIWLTGEQQGLGASRSQGYGRYTITRWDAVRSVPRAKPVAKKAAAAAKKADTE